MDYSGDEPADPILLLRGLRERLETELGQLEHIHRRLTEHGAHDRETCLLLQASHASLWALLTTLEVATDVWEWAEAD